MAMKYALRYSCVSVVVLHLFYLFQMRNLAISIPGWLS